MENKKVKVMVTIDDESYEGTLELTAKVENKDEKSQDCPPAGNCTENKAPEEKVAFSEDQIKKIKEIKVSFGIEDNKGLDEYLYKWSNGKVKSYKNLTPENANDFIKFMLTD